MSSGHDGSDQDLNSESAEGSDGGGGGGKHQTASPPKNANGTSRHRRAVPHYSLGAVTNEEGLFQMDGIDVENQQPLSDGGVDGGDSDVDDDPPTPPTARKRPLGNSARQYACSLPINVSVVKNFLSLSLSLPMYILLSLSLTLVRVCVQRPLQGYVHGR